MTGRHLTILKAKAPGINQRRHCDIESTFRLTGNLHRLLKDIKEHLIRFNGLIIVNSRDDRLLIER